MLDSSSSIVDEATRQLFWPWDRLHAALEGLILKSGLPTTGISIGTKPSVEKPIPLEALMWILRGPREVGLEANEAEVSLDDLLALFISSRGPALVVVTLQRGDWGIARPPVMVVASVIFEGRWARVLKPDGSEVRLRRTALHAAIVRLLAASASPLEGLFRDLPGGSTAFEGLLRAGKHVGDVQPISFFRLELDAAHPIRAHLRMGRAWTALAVHISIGIVQVVAGFGALWTLGNSALDGRVDLGRVLAWSLLALCDVPLQYLANHALLPFSFTLTTALRKRVLEGAFFTPEHDIRAQGFGRLLALSNESNIIEQVSLAEVSSAISSLLLLISAAIFFLRGAMPSVMLSIFCVFLFLGGLAARARTTLYGQMFNLRITLTDDLADKIIGHRTRVVQQAPSLRHVAEDQSTSNYARTAQAYDRSVLLTSILPRAWLVAAATGMVAAFVLHAQSRLMLWSGIGILMAFRGFDWFFLAFERIIQWHSAWRGVEPLFEAGRQRERPSRKIDLEVSEELPTALSLSTVSFSHRQGGRPVFTDADLIVRIGEKVLLEGGSGSGKTTLLKLLAGEVQADAGVVLVGGTDRFSTSEEEWRRRVASAPQFHENHLFSNTLMFNLDPWSTARASAETIEICKELGLGPVIERMPLRMKQLVGETGWQLSHGERSRIFMVRALVQKADIFLFDENFGSLDPETLLQALECVRRRTKTLIVVAHT